MLGTLGAEVTDYLSAEGQVCYLCRWGGRTISVLVQSVLVLEAVVSVRNLETLQLGQAEDVQHHLTPIT